MQYGKTQRKRAKTNRLLSVCIIALVFILLAGYVGHTDTEDKTQILSCNSAK